MHPKELIRKALTISKYPVVAFSGGKDSSVVLHLVRSINPNVKAVWCNHGVAYRETEDFCRAIPNIVELKPKTTFWKCVEKYGWPKVKDKASSHGNRCCYYLKEKPMIDYIKAEGIDLIFTGLTSAESRSRWMFFKRMGAYYYMKSWNVWKCHPIWDWTEQNVWDFIKENNIPYNPKYDQGAIRIGCLPCTAYIDWKRRLARENPKMLRVVLKKQGQWQLDHFCGGGA